MGGIHDRLRLLLCSLSLTVLTGCAGLPKGIEPVQDFELNRYLGRWYEVARLDHSFERGLTRVMTEYSMRDDGGVKVVNRGYQAESGSWKEAVGRAYFVRSPREGYLKVSFFRPFYGTYVIMELDQGYEYALVCGANRKYLWILAREPDLDEVVKQRLIARAKELGFAVDKLIYPQVGDPRTSAAAQVDL
nr:lipocalin family protein [Desulfosediminicola ganghwensis]